MASRRSDPEALNQIAPLLTEVKDNLGQQGRDLVQRLGVGAAGGHAVKLAPGLPNVAFKVFGGAQIRPAEEAAP